mmetsp:Transcript_14741/g.30012  ORF Transcript_14741/g.30012 Transcript_14741/m.30012 type:complete len:606 (-) Transcript_14741:186-2003(-)
MMKVFSLVVCLIAFHSAANVSAFQTRQWSLHMPRLGQSSSACPSAAIHGRKQPPLILQQQAQDQSIEDLEQDARSLIPKGVNLKDKKNTLIKASVAGMAVALAMVPEAVAFSFVAGVNPLTGLWTTVLLGFTAASLGGRAGICSSASGACSIVVASLGRSHGPTYLAATAILVGLFQMTGAILNLGRFIRLVPHPVMLGFVNGLAIVMTKSQLTHFQGLSLATKAGASTYGIAALTMALIKVFPKVTKAIPPTLGAVILATIATRVLGLPVTTLTDVAGASTFAGGWQVLPKLGLPQVPFTFETFKVVAPYALIMAAVGSIESLLTMQLVDNMMDDGKRGSTKREVFGQGAGNFVSGMFGGIGGCALLGQSIINVQSGGGVSRWSGMSMALFLAMGIVAAAPLLGAVPVSSLVGVMLLVCQQTFSWSSLRLLNKIPRLDAAVIALVSFVTVQRDLAQAVLAGTITSALGFAWKQSTAIRAKTGLVSDNRKKYALSGPLFFASTTKFNDLFDVKSDPQEIVIDFQECRVMDHSGLEAVQSLVEKYQTAGKSVALMNLSRKCEGMLSDLVPTVSVGCPTEEVPSDEKTEGTTTIKILANGEANGKDT